jgi:hypothetical protein
MFAPGKAPIQDLRAYNLKGSVAGSRHFVINPLLGALFWLTSAVLYTIVGNPSGNMAVSAEFCGWHQPLAYKGPGRAN